MQFTGKKAMSQSNEQNPFEGATSYTIYHKNGTTLLNYRSGPSLPHTTDVLLGYATAPTSFIQAAQQAKVERKNVSGNL